MKKIVRITTVMIIISLISVALFGCGGNPLVSSDNPFGLAGLDVKPAGAAMATVDVNLEGDDAIAEAVRLYELANYNDKMASHRAIYSVCPTSNRTIVNMGVKLDMDNIVLLNILEIKNDNEFYRIDYRLRDDCPLFDYLSDGAMQSINDRIRLVATERRYANTDMDHTRYQIVSNALTDEDGIPYANWPSSVSEIEELTDPENHNSRPRIFSAEQEGDFIKSDHTINVNTVSEATLAHNTDESFYTVTMVLDVENEETTSITRPLIQEGSDTESAEFTSITIEFEIWDNGYYKSFKSSEYWGADMKMVVSIDLSSSFLYHDIYSYDIEDCDISNYYKDGEFVNDYN